MTFKEWFKTAPRTSISEYAAKAAWDHQQAKNDEIKAVVNEQAEDEGLWFDPKYATEDYLQQALRHLHAVIEGDK